MHPFYQFCIGKICKLVSSERVNSSHTSFFSRFEGSNSFTPRESKTFMFSVCLCEWTRKIVLNSIVKYAHVTVVCENKLRLKEVIFFFDDVSMKEENAEGAFSLMFHHTTPLPSDITFLFDQCKWVSRRKKKESILNVEIKSARRSTYHAVGQRPLDNLGYSTLCYAQHASSRQWRVVDAAWRVKFCISTEKWKIVICE